MGMVLAWVFQPLPRIMKPSAANCIIGHFRKTFSCRRIITFMIPNSYVLTTHREKTIECESWALNIESIERHCCESMQFCTTALRAPALCRPYGLPTLEVTITVSPHGGVLLESESSTFLLVRTGFARFKYRSPGLNLIEKIGTVLQCGDRVELLDKRLPRQG